MRKSFFLIIVTLLLASCSGSVSSEENNANAAILKNGERISLPQYEIELIKPAEWGNAEREGAVVFHQNCAKTVSFCPNIAIKGQAIPPAEQVDVEEYATDFQTQMKSAYPSFELLNSQEKEIDNKPAYSIKYTIKEQGLALIGKATFVQVKQNLMSVSYMELESQGGEKEPNNEAIFEAVTASIKEQE